MIGQVQSESWSPAGGDFFLFAPELAWVATLCVLMIAPLLVGRKPRTSALIVLVGMAVTGFLTLKVASEVAPAGKSGLSPVEASGMLLVDNLSVYFKFLLVIFVAGVTVLWWSCSSDTEDDAPEFFVLLAGSGLGMVLMVSTLNLLMMVVAIEFASLPSYAIVGFDKKNRRSAEASLKYLIFGAISAAIMLYGVSLVYGYCGTLNIAAIADRFADAFAAGQDTLILGFAMFCVFAGIAFKISAVPFHFWCPDAFEGAKTEVTAWLSVASKAAGLLLLLRFLTVFATSASQAAPNLVTAIAWTVGILAAITATVGNLGAYAQQSVKRMLAYSSIAHAGYMLMAAAAIIVPATGSGGSYAALSAVLAYVAIYMLMNLGAFGVTAMVATDNGGDDTLPAFSGLMRRAPQLAVPMLFCLISLVGLPPFAGFMAKYWLLIALGGAKSTLCWGLIVVAVVNTLISLWYYMRIVVAMMLKDDEKPAVNTPLGGTALVNLCAAMLLLLLVFPQPLKDRADKYAGNLFNLDPATMVAYAQPGKESENQ